MTISRFAARIGDLFGRMPGALPALHGLALSGLVACAAWAPAAHAVPVLSPASSVVIPATSAGIYINVVTGVFGATPASSPGWDINPWGTGSLFLYAGTGGGFSTVGAATTPGSLSAGTVIGLGSGFTSTVPSAAVFGAGAGQWTLNAPNYFGFRFTSEDALIHYGYGVMTVGATALIRTVTSLWYEDVAGASITIPAIPEPSSAAMLLAGGLLGLHTLRRRRQDGR
jgi:hypothetical protein